MHSQTYNANGDINPCRFVNIETLDDTVSEADSAEVIHGISQRFPRAAPIEGASTLAAAAGQELTVHLAGARDVLLEIGSGGCTPGMKLIADTDGKGIAMGSTAATKYNVGAIAKETRLAGEFARVDVHIEAVTFPA